MERPMELKRKKILVGVGLLSFVFLLVVFGPSGIYYSTSTPDYCGSCHVMDDKHEQWFLSGLHRNITCVDCHLPNNNFANHMLWKGIDGMKDFLYFHLAIFSEPIEITGHGKNTVRKNCIRCHGEMVSLIDNERNCWECHRRVNHRITPVAHK